MPLSRAHATIRVTALTFLLVAICVFLPVEAVAQDVHVVQKGDTLYSIAKSNGVSLNDIYSWNSLGPDSVLQPGQRITLGPPSAEALSVGSGTKASERYTVEKGDTMWSIARKTGVALKDILGINGLREDSIIHPGLVLRLNADSSATSNSSEAATRQGSSVLSQPSVFVGVTGAVVPVPVVGMAGEKERSSSATVMADSKEKTASSVGAVPAALTSAEPAGEARLIIADDPDQGREALERLKNGPESGFAWPVNGRLTSSFGRRWGRMHEGIDLGVPTGTPVRCSADGVVTFAGWSGGYGRLVIVDHGGGWETRYAHNSELRVSAGDTVHKGQVIARSGASGQVTGPHVHFEVRRDNQPYDPLRFLNK